LKDLVDGWYEAELNGLTGFVPETYVERIGPKRDTTKKKSSPSSQLVAVAVVAAGSANGKN